MTLLDVKNALPSVFHQALNGACDEVMWPEHQNFEFMVAHHSLVVAQIQAAENDAASLLPSTGGMQGDIAIPDMFGRAYDPQIAR